MCATESDVTPSSARQVRRTAAILFLLSLSVQLLAMVAVARVRGSAAIYAYQSPDAGEYVSLARGLAWYHAYFQVDGYGRPMTGPDTWRTPGFPGLLSIVVRFCGDSVVPLLLLQQFLTALTVPLLYLIARRHASQCASLLIAIAWCLDPFRVYYAFWILAETLFTLVVLACAWCYGRASARGWNVWRALLLGVLTGATVLVRPIGLLLPVLAMVGAGWGASRLSGLRRRALVTAVACGVGAAAVVGPWLLRNRRLTGHASLSHQAGASLAYHKVLDVLLWSKGAAAYRFDPAMQDHVRRQIDERLRAKWTEQLGPPTADVIDDLTWRKLNYDAPVSIDPFVASRVLQQVSFDVLRERWPATIACFGTQGLSMLVFPLGLVVVPPAGDASTPLASIAGGGRLSQVLAVLIGSAYALLLVMVLWRLWSSAWERCWPAHFFVLWPGLALFLLSVPSEDPRFRLPLVPLMLLMALPLRRSKAGAAITADPSPLSS